MPIYEYKCQDCESQFERIRRIKEADADLACVRCQSHNVRRVISLFNAASGGRALGGSSGCGTCSSNSCSTCGLDS